MDDDRTKRVHVTSVALTHERLANGSMRGRWGSRKSKVLKTKQQDEQPPATEGPFPGVDLDDAFPADADMPSEASRGSKLVRTYPRLEKISIHSRSGSYTRMAQGQGVISRRNSALRGFWICIEYRLLLVLIGWRFAKVSRLLGWWFTMSVVHGDNSSSTSFS